MLKLFLHAWLRFARTLARINAYILLTLIFVLAVVPVGLLFQLFGRSIVTQASNRNSRWEGRENDHDPKRPF